MSKVISPYIENTLKAYIKKLEEIQAISEQKINLYATGSEELDLIFSSIHVQLDEIFSKLNEHHDVKGNLNRNLDLLMLTQILHTYIEEIYKELLNTPFDFYINKYTEDIFTLLNNYRNISFIPEIRLFETIPMFELKNGASILPYCNNKTIDVEELGEGSYAVAKRYHDPFYDIDVVVKEAKKDISKKDIERFKQEYRVMHELHSPHVAQVYRFEERPLRYFMEYMDQTLYDFIRNGHGGSYKVKTDIVLQMIEGLKYIWSRGYLHRDLSIVNIYIKKYDDCIVLKFADFGLVKDSKNNLTSGGSLMKGHFNDPALQREGFENYKQIHEIYSLTRMIYFVLSGDIEIDNIQPIWREFVVKGTNPDKNKRYQNLSEVEQTFEQMMDNISSRE